MQLQFKTKNVELTDSLRDYADLKVGMLTKLLADNPDDSMSCLIELTTEEPNKGGEYRADLTLYAGEIRTHAVGRGETLNAAIDAAKDELERRLRRDKKKKLTLFKKGARKIKDMLRFGK